MQYGLESYHPFSQFDLAAIGIALVLVMGILAVRRIARMIWPAAAGRAKGADATNGFTEDDAD
jgi:hypothetical protein